MNKTTYNFCAGPAALPKEVMLKAKAEMLDWQGLGVSVMEISHRSEAFKAVALKAENDLRKLMKIGDDHAVLFLHGGATHQFANVPMCLLQAGKTAEYITNGVWSGLAYQEALRFGQVHQIDALAIDDKGLRSLTKPQTWQRIDDPAYTHYVVNETIEGMRFQDIPASNGSIIADMSSCILSEELNCNDFDMIYAGAQKNIGPAGMSIVIVKRSLFEQMNFGSSPIVFNYQQQDKKGSMINTPPTYSWYLAGLVFEWVLAQGGVAAMSKLAQQKSKLLYQLIDEDDFYTNPIAIQDRSLMNVPFVLPNEELTMLFLEQAKQANLVGLKGHRTFGGIRASLYNSLPLDGVKALTNFMREFKQDNG